MEEKQLGLVVVDPGLVRQDESRIRRLLVSVGVYKLEHAEVDVHEDGGVDQDGDEAAHDVLVVAASSIQVEADHVPEHIEAPYVALAAGLVDVLRFAHFQLSCFLYL